MTAETDKVVSIVREAQDMRARLPYQIVQVVDLKTNTRSFKIYRRGTMGGRSSPLVIGLPTRADAEAKVRELQAIEGNKP